MAASGDDCVFNPPISGRMTHRSLSTSLHQARLQITRDGDETIPMKPLQFLHIWILREYLDFEFAVSVMDNVMWCRVGLCLGNAMCVVHCFAAPWDVVDTL